MQSDNNLYLLLQSDSKAREFYKSLPIDTQINLSQNFADTSTFSDLYKSAEYLFHTGGTSSFTD